MISIKTSNRRTASAVDTEAGKEVTVENICHRYGDVSVLDGVDLSVRAGEFLTLLGPSGSGKTTLLKIIAGMENPQSGRIWIGDRDVTQMPSRKRNVGFVFQNYALFPNMTVARNVGYGLKIRRLPTTEREARIAEALRLVDLSGLENRMPSALSGGQQQRVSLARAIVIQPDVLLMDEPLGSLDKRLRQRLQVDLRLLQRRLGITTIYVTHDQEEAFSMSHRIAVMHEGAIRQVDSPESIYREPRSSFIASFVGDINNLTTIASANGRYVGVRPENLRISRHRGDVRSVAARIETVIFLGSVTRIRIAVQGQLVVVDCLAPKEEFSEGDEVFVFWDETDTVILDGTDAERSTE